MILGARQNIQFFRQKPGFSELIEICLNLSKEFALLN